MSRRLQCEPLENRSLLAGNVLASVSNGNLLISGDAAGNTISVESLGSGVVQVRGFGTSINGAANAIRTFQVTGDVNIDMGDGDDVLRVTNVLLPGDLNIVLGTGNNDLLMGRTTAGDTTRFGSTGTGPLQVSGNLQIAGGVQTDKVSQADVHVGGLASINLDGGNDQFNTSRITGATENVTYNGALALAMGAGNDLMNVVGLQTNNNVNVSAAGTLNAIATAINVQGSLNVSTGVGNDTITLKDAVVRDRFFFALGAGDDTVAANNLTGRVLFQGGDGNDRLNISQTTHVDLVRFEGGAGNDQMNFTASTVPQIYGFGGDGDDIFFLRGTQATDVILYGDAGIDTYRESITMPNVITNLKKYSIEKSDHVQ
jgi:hypothetical protein